MKISNKMNAKTKSKQQYIAPLLLFIKLDNEISLALESTPPIFPGEETSNAPEYFNNDSFRNQNPTMS